MSRSTGASVSIASAVPAGEVIARDEVLGMTSPWAATIATTIGVVRLPGSPPIQCLSTTIGESQRKRSPTSTMAPGQIDGLLLVERKRGARRQEGRQMHISIAACGDVLDDRLDGVRVEPVSVDPPADTREGFECRCMRDGDRRALFEPQDLPSGLRQGNLVDGEQIVPFDLEQGCLHLPAAARHQDLRSGSKTFRSADMAVGPHDDHRLVLCVQPKTFGAEWRWGGEFGRGVTLIHRSNA